MPPDRLDPTGTSERNRNFTLRVSSSLKRSMVSPMGRGSTRS